MHRSDCIVEVERIDVVYIPHASTKRYAVVMIKPIPRLNALGVFAPYAMLKESCEDSTDIVQTAPFVKPIEDGIGIAMIEEIPNLSVHSYHIGVAFK